MAKKGRPAKLPLEYVQLKRALDEHGSVELAYQIISIRRRLKQIEDKLGLTSVVEVTGSSKYNR